MKFAVCALALLLVGALAPRTRAADPIAPPSAECRYALSQAVADPKNDAKARTCRARCAAFPDARGQCPRLATPPPAPACDPAHAAVVDVARPDPLAIQRCVDRCGGRSAKADECRARAQAVCDDAAAASVTGSGSAEELDALLERADGIAVGVCRLLGSDAKAEHIERFRADVAICRSPAAAAGDSAACAACTAARAALPEACEPRIDTPPDDQLPPHDPGPHVTDDACRQAGLAAQRAYERNDQHPVFAAHCLAMCSGGTDPDALFWWGECRDMQAQAGRVALMRMVEPTPAPWTLEPGSDAPVLAPWLGPLDNERRSLRASGWALQAGAGAHVRDGAVRGFDGGGSVVKGDGAGGVLEARALVRGRRPSISAEADGGLELRTLPSALSSSGLAFERAHAVVGLGSLVDGLIGDRAQVDFVGQIGARRMPSHGISLRGTTLLWSLGLTWSDLTPGGSGLVAGVEVDGADYGVYDSTARFAPLGARIPLTASIGLAPGAAFEGFISASFAPRWLKDLGFALPTWATVGASGCPWEQVCADVSVDVGVRPLAGTASAGLDNPPYYTMETSWIARGKAALSVRFDDSSAMRAGVMVDPVSIPIRAYEVYKRPRLVQQALFFADARLAWDGAAYDQGYFRGEAMAFWSLDMPRLPLVIDAQVSIPLGASVGLALGARIPLGPLELAVRYRGTPMFLGGYERDFSATVGVDVRHALER